MSEGYKNIEEYFPALYKSAGKLSETSQANYLWSLRFEYSLLIVCSAMGLNQVKISSYYYLYTFLLVMSLGLFLWRSVNKPEQSWYQGRALAESIKTASWRFCMRAQPFDDVDDHVSVANFNVDLKRILASNQYAGNRLPPEFAADHQISELMIETRGKPLEDRKKIYNSQRIDSQRKWYAGKAKKNRNWATVWIFICISVYGLAVVSSLYKASDPDLTFMPADVLIAIASSIVGWMQIKKFNELAASYILTAHEIGILHTQFRDDFGEVEFSAFVTEAEQAFSREHTQWVARSI